jgi:hypothetical protein
MKACKKIGSGSVLQIWAVRTEQGFEYRQHGTSDRTILDYGGLALVTTYKPRKKQAQA